MMTTTFFKKGEYIYYVLFNLNKVVKLKILDIEERGMITIITTENEKHRKFMYLTGALKANIAKNLPYLTLSSDAFFVMDKQTTYKLIRKRYMQREPIFQYQQEVFREIYRRLLMTLKKL